MDHKHQQTVDVNKIDQKTPFLSSHKRVNTPESGRQPEMVRSKPEIVTKPEVTCLIVSYTIYLCDHTVQVFISSFHVFLKYKTHT